MAGTATARSGTRRREQPRPGRGRLLSAAFEETERFPALKESHDRALTMLARGSAVSEVAMVVEPDVGLTIAVVRATDDVPRSERVRGVAQAMEMLGPQAVGEAIQDTPTHDFFEQHERLPLRPEQFRLHALAVQRATDRIGD